MRLSETIFCLSRLIFGENKTTCFERESQGKADQFDSLFRNILLNNTLTLFNPLKFQNV